MKLLDKAIDSAVARSSTLKSAIVEFGRGIEQMEQMLKLAVSVKELTVLVQKHEMFIEQMSAVLRANAMSKVAHKKEHGNMDLPPITNEKNAKSN